MEDDLPELLDEGTPEERRNKTKRYMELKDDVQKAFNKDKAINKDKGELHRSGLSSSTSSPTTKIGNHHKIRRLT